MSHNFSAKHFSKLPKILQFIVVYVGSLTAVFVALRWVFWMVYDDVKAPLSTPDFIHAMWLGFRFDLRIAIATILPLFFVGWIKGLNPFQSKISRAFWHVYLTLVFTVIALSYIVDFGHFAYLNSRLNFTASRFLENAAISASMVWESYPVLWILAAYIASVCLFVWSINRLHAWVSKQPSIKLKARQGVLVGLSSFLLVALGAHSKFSQYPLRWSEAAFSQHPFAAQLSYNPLHYFFDTWKNGRINFDLEATRSHYEVMAEFLGVKDKDPMALNYQRDIPASKGIEGKPNLVLILVESYATYKTSLSGNPLNATPFTQKLADEGYYFKNFFTPSTGTARSVFTTITGMPDVELHGTSSRNPLVVDQHSIMNQFEGYEKYYFIGGSASWGNIRGILTKNIENLHLYEEGDYGSPRNDVWGISDIDLFREAHAVLEKETKPFIAVIQTSGNHRPYTIPEERYGFELKPLNKEKALRYGFLHEEDYNAYRLVDYAMEHFVGLSKNAGYDKNTIFALWGDHGSDGFAGEHVPKGESASYLNLGSYRVPFVIWAPDLIKIPKVFDTVMSEVDVLPSLARLIGQPYTATTMGRDIFDERYVDRRYAFTIAHSNPPRIGMVGADYYFHMLSDGTQAGLYDIHSDKPLEDQSPKHPDLALRLKSLSLAYYTTSQYMLHHNKQAQVKPPKF